MTQELIRRGNECQAAGDIEGAEAAFRKADEQNDAEGAILLGLLLEQRSELPAAADAFRRAEARGHPEAGSCLGSLLSDSGDYEGAKAAYERSIAAGSADAVMNLGLMLAQLGAADEALPLLKVAQASGDIGASRVIGRLLEDQGDLKGASAAYRQATVGGDADAAFDLGAVLTRLEDQEGAREAFQRAHELGNPDAQGILVRLTAADAVHEGMKLAKSYAAACDDVLTAANICLEIANRAVGAREMAAERPQHEISIRNFTDFAEKAEQEFVRPYQQFSEASLIARTAAAELLASQVKTIEAEMLLTAAVDADGFDRVATAWAILTAEYGSSPSAFIDGVSESNRLLEVEREGNIYRPLEASLSAVAPSDERACPWCAETIKAAAIICRFCGRDVQSDTTIQ